jgi:hypothetical protein
MVAGLASLVCVVALFAVLAPESTWSPAILLGTLLAVALWSYFGAFVFRTATRLDASFVAALIAVVMLGPVPAALIWLATEAFAFVVERRKIEAFVANAASFGAAALAGSLIVDGFVGGLPIGSPAAGAYAAIGIAGIAMILVNFFVGAVLIDFVRDRRSLIEVITKELFEPAPATLSMIALGVAASFLYVQIGILALVAFAAAAAVPQSLVPVLLRTRPVSELGHSDAVALYADAIAAVLRLDRKTRNVLKDAAPFLRDRALTTQTGRLAQFNTAHRLALVEAVIYHGEHWDGGGGSPGAVGGEMIPVTSRVLLLADAWSGLTAQGSPGLTHSQALRQMESKAGMHFDPRVFRAAITVVKDERLGHSGQVACQPRLHKLPVPQLARRMLGRLASNIAGPAIGAPVEPLSPAPAEVSYSGYRR